MGREIYGKAVQAVIARPSLLPHRVVTGADVAKTTLSCHLRDWVSAHISTASLVARNIIDDYSHLYQPNFLFS